MADATLRAAPRRRRISPLKRAATFAAALFAGACVLAVDAIFSLTRTRWEG